jgi:hypothetical protein
MFFLAKYIIGALFIAHWDKAIFIAKEIKPFLYSSGLPSLSDSF